MKFSIHPLFFVFGLYFALTGKVFLFLTATLTALLHEFGHALAAEKLGYKMNKITLMPYGAVVNGAIGGLSYKDEVSVALAGPLTNLAICVLFSALWWAFPESYPYTDTVVLSNFSIATINLIPAFPLDGGRILSAALSMSFPRRKVMLAMKISGLVIGLALFGLFVYSLFVKANISLLFFSLFIIVGALQKTEQSTYVRMYMEKMPTGGIKECKRYMVSGDTTLKTLMKNTRGECLYCLDVAVGDNIVFLDLADTQKLLASYRYYDKIKDIAVDIKQAKLADTEREKLA